MPVVGRWDNGHARCRPTAAGFEATGTRRPNPARTVSASIATAMTYGRRGTRSGATSHAVCAASTGATRNAVSSGTPRPSTLALTQLPPRRSPRGASRARRRGLRGRAWRRGKCTRAPVTGPEDVIRPEQERRGHKRGRRIPERLCLSEGVAPEEEFLRRHQAKARGRPTRAARRQAPELKVHAAADHRRIDINALQLRELKLRIQCALRQFCFHGPATSGTSDRGAICFTTAYCATSTPRD